MAEPGGGGRYIPPHLRGNRGRRGFNPGYRGRGGYNANAPRGRGGNRRRNEDDLLMGEQREENYDNRRSRTRPIGYKKLEEIEEKETPQDIVLILGTGKSGLEETLRGDRGPLNGGLTQMLLRVFGKMCDSDESTQSLTHILQLILKHDFHQKIIDFLFGLLTEHINRRSRAPLHLNNALKLMNSLLTVLPNDSHKKVSMTMIIIDSVIDGLGSVNEDVYNNRMLVKDRLNNFQQRQQDAIERAAGSRESRFDDLHSQAPPDNFREIPVFPQLSDIHGTAQLFIRTNLIDKAYQNIDHYLDVQFRLLREDFIRPLREGIGEIMHYGDRLRPRGQGPIQNVKVYKDVKIEFMKPDQRGILHRIHFSLEGLQRIRWRNTKRLLYGNLLCLSSDHFKENVHFAVVADRKPEDLAEGYLTLEFVYDEEEEEPIRPDVDDDGDEDLLEFLDSDDDGDEPEIGGARQRQPRQQPEQPQHRRFNKGLDMRKVYTMVETEAYFEAYRHVLAGLKETEEIPLERYIVRCENNMYAPEYLRPSVAGRDVSYDFSSVTESASGKDVAVLGYEWPLSAELGLDISQAEALKLALTNELAIIQGPPGTGKTYVGLVIMKLLLANKTSWHMQPRFLLGAQNENKRCPILIVCYTNHALDQFLEGISKFATEDQTIIRVGGRCKNEATKGFSLFNVRRKLRQNRDRGKNSAAIRKAIWEIHDGLRSIEGQLQHNCNQLEASLHCIQRLQQLEDVIPRQLYSQFQPRMPLWNQYNWNNTQTESPDEMLLTWLGLRTTVNEVDYEKEARRLHDITQAILLSSGYTLDEIGRAVHATESSDIETLLTWIRRNRTGSGQSSGGATAATTQNEGTEEVDQGGDDDIAGEAEYLQDQRVLDTDEFPLNAEARQAKTARDNERDVKRLMTQMAAMTFKDIGEQEKRQDDGGWQQQSHEKKKKKQRIRRELGKTTTMTDQEESRVDNIYDLSQEQRWSLYRTWVSRWRDKFRVGTDRQIEKYNRLSKQLQELRKREDAEILQSADVVAVTTTGAAKYRELIYKLNCKIVVIEEAAEVLEAHIITSMPKTTKHLILIGDHQQLKPSPTVYELARKYNLDTSLFERLINKVPHVTLTLQHRMRPEIADLLRPRIYKNLLDHSSVKGRAEIVGVEKTLYFISHAVPEESVADGRSKKNQHEADFLVALCKYLILQGYRPEQITILAMYTGQLFAFRNTLKEESSRGVRVTAVDNFQGEENDIILLSLVRSNDEQKIGFLGVENRICVALSRAKNALYCIGNMELLGTKSSMWRKIIGHLEENDSIGENLQLQCKHHPNKLTPVKSATDFIKVPEGGCGQPCNTRLDCGHVCSRPCHPDDHSSYQCSKPCDKILCSDGHRCKQKCYQQCGPCREPLKKRMPICGHVQKIPCHQDPASFGCKEIISVLVDCGHTIKVQCHQSSIVTLGMCKEKCGYLLECRHPCRGNCYECFQGRLHVPCLRKCNRTLVCGHECKSSCESCPPCEQKCKTRCEHSECNHKCGKPCTLCREKCKWQCPHFRCTQLCSEPCNRPRCNRPCQKKLNCKHQCIGLCGEPCPRFCRICHKDTVTEIFFGDEDEDDARFVQLDDCRHIFTYEGLDKWMEQKEEGNAIKMKECPKCKTPIWRSRRYGNIINKLLMSNKVTTERSPQTALAGRRNTLPYQLKLLEEQYRRLSKLSEMRKVVAKLLLLAPGSTSKLVDVVSRDLRIMRTWVMRRREFSTPQENEAFQRECKKINEALKYIDVERKYARQGKPRAIEVDPLFASLKELLFDNYEPYVGDKKEEVKTLFKRIFDKVPVITSGLGVSEQEKEMICKAMGFAAKGHWYKCSKGHIYSIGDCGGATVTSVCPDCKEQIGGTSHRLLTSNRIASEMDGATRPAYDPMNNYIPDHLLQDLRRQGFE
uniref:NFX1-type zinc finger-containing protein 1-like n=1 Tax=Styela clava TaxID=7725 RepID=UPI00193AD577|nr:NFX1-type zinc finger-containing protein 1-like [Styela clava]